MKKEFSFDITIIIDLIIILTALAFTISALIISHFNRGLQILTLTILTVILPVIYQIGNSISKEIVKNKNERDFSEAQDTIENLKENVRYYEESNIKMESAMDGLENENSDLIDYIDELELELKKLKE